MENPFVFPRKMIYKQLKMEIQPRKSRLNRFVSYWFNHPQWGNLVFKHGKSKGEFYGFLWQYVMTVTGRGSKGDKWKNVIIYVPFKAIISHDNPIPLIKHTDSTVLNMWFHHLLNYDKPGGVFSVRGIVCLYYIVAYHIVLCSILGSISHYTPIISPLTPI